MMTVSLQHNIPAYQTIFISLGYDEHFKTSCCRHFMLLAAASHGAAKKHLCKN